MYFFFFNDTATTEIYTLSLHDALPISGKVSGRTSNTEVTLFKSNGIASWDLAVAMRVYAAAREKKRSEEHTSELQSQSNLVCRLLLEKKQHHNSSYNSKAYVYHSLTTA